MTLNIRSREDDITTLIDNWWESKYIWCSWSAEVGPGAFQYTTQKSYNWITRVYTTTLVSIHVELKIEGGKLLWRYDNKTGLGKKFTFTWTFFTLFQNSNKVGLEHYLVWCGVGGGKITVIQVQDREKRCRQKPGSKRRMTNLYLNYPSFLKNCVPEWSLACPAPPSLDQYTVSQWASPIPESHVYQSTTSIIIPLHNNMFSKENHLKSKKATW